MITQYKHRLSEIAPIFMNPNGLSDIKWKQLIDNVDQSVLDDAISKQKDVMKMLSSVNLIPRLPKKMERINVKKNQVNQMWFKVVSDFLAFRINTNVTTIPSTIIDVQTQLFNNDRSARFYNKGSCYNDNKYTDIVQYFYAYMPVIGHVVEFQVGHELAAYTFKIDSALRDDPECKEVDLWTDGVYGILKNRILEDANNQEYSMCKYDIYCAVWSLYKAPQEPPLELRRILDNICEKKQ